LADCQQAQGKKAPAFNNYEKAYTLLKKKAVLRKKMLPRVKEPDLYAEMAYCLNAMGEYDKAKLTGMSGGMQGPSPDLLVNLAYAFYKLNQEKLARDNFCKSRQITKTPELNNLTYVRLKSLIENNQDWINCPVAEVKKGTNHALIIGVGKYRDSNITPLKYVENDARELYRVLTDHRTGFFKPENVSILLNQKATERKIRFKFDDIAAKAQEDDLLLIFYAGHGFTYPDSDTYWLTYDTVYGRQGNRIQSSAFSNLIMGEKIRNIKAKTLIFFIDACYSSGMVDISTAVRGLETDLRAGKDYVIITSSQANQRSMESPSLRHGLFSYFLVKGLAGEADTNGDGIVNIEELWDFVQPRVSENAIKRGGEQDPRRVVSTGRAINISKNPNY
jgi:hypothetical protein